VWGSAAEKIPADRDGKLDACGLKAGTRHGEKRAKWGANRWVQSGTAQTEGGSRRNLHKREKEKGEKGRVEGEIKRLDGKGGKGARDSRGRGGGKPSEIREG